MVTPGSKFTRKKEEAIAALLTQQNVEEAARAAGVGTQTLLRWLKVPEFVKEYRKARREAVHQAIARLQQATGAAATIVLKLMNDPNVPAAARLQPENQESRQSESPTPKNIFYVPCPQCGENEKPAPCTYCGGSGFVEILRY